MKIRVCVRLSILFLLLSVTPAMAQGSSNDTRVVVYPLLGWAPIFGADVPSIPSRPGGGGDSRPGGAIDSSLNGALMFGFVVEKEPWRLDADGIWAALHGDRPANPVLNVDLDLIYGHVSGGRRLYKELYVTGGVRRVAMNYDIELQDFDAFSRKVGVWDPLIGVAWHHERDKVEFHAVFEGGGFGVGADKDLLAGFRVDWKPISHFRLTAGYAGIHLKISDTVLGRTLVAAQTLQGPILGVGFDF